jgi:hypothetical protein
MGRTRTVGLVLGVVLASGVVGASSALAAAPEFGRCVKKASVGEAGFSNASCTKAVGTGAKFEWEGVAKTHFVTRLKEGTPTLEGTNLSKLTCTAEEGSGEITGPKTVGNVTLKFNGCETPQMHCMNADADEIVMNPLQGELGIYKLGETAVKDLVALELSPQSGVSLAEIECAGLRLTVRGSVLVQMTANRMLGAMPANLLERRGEQMPDHFVGGITDEHTLESSADGGAFEETSLALRMLLEDEEPIEISSVN